MTKNILSTRLFGIYLRVDETRGWWFSLGLHVDFQHRSVDLHFLWWIVTIGDPMKGREGSDPAVWSVWSPVEFTHASYETWMQFDGGEWEKVGEGQT